MTYDVLQVPKASKDITINPGETVTVLITLMEPVKVNYGLVDYVMQLQGFLINRLTGGREPATVTIYDVENNVVELTANPGLESSLGGYVYQIQGQFAFETGGWRVVAQGLANPQLMPLVSF